MRKRAAGSCEVSQERIRHQKLQFAAYYIPLVFAFVYTTLDFLGHQALLCRDTVLWYSCTVVSGISMNDVGTRKYRLRTNLLGV